MFTCHMLIQLSCAVGFYMSPGFRHTGCSFLAGITIICDCFDLIFRMFTRHTLFQSCTAVSPCHQDPGT